MKKLYKFETRVGDFYLSVHTNGRFYIFLEDDLIDHYHSIPAALDELTGGHCPWPLVDGILTDTSSLGISDDLSHWDKVP